MISDTYKPIKTLANGTTVNFSFNWAIISLANIRVFLEDKTTGVQTQVTTGFSIVFDDSTPGGVVTFDTAPTSDYYVILARSIPQTQEVDYKTASGFQGSVIQRSFDKLTAMVQDLMDSAKRSMQLPLGTDMTYVNANIPAPKAGKPIVGNDDESGFTNSTIDLISLESKVNAVDQAVSDANSAKTQAVEAKTQAVEAKTQAVEAKNQSVEAKNEAVSVASALANTKLRFMFEPIWSDHIISSMSLLRADTFSWQNGEVYTAAYDLLVAEYDDVSGTDESETIGGVTINYRRTPSGFRIVDETKEGNVASIFSAVGVAWYYIIDITNQRFKLPRTQYSFVGLRNKVGDYIPESLPNITGEFGHVASRSNGDVQVATGAFYQASAWQDNFGSASNWNSPVMGLNASRCSPAYQNNAPVQQRATQMYLYFYVGNTPINVEELNIGQLAEGLNGKADVDASNFSATGKSTITSLLNVAYDQGSDVTASAYASSGTGWTPPKAGIIYAVGTNSNGTCSCTIYLNGTQVVSRNFNGSSASITTPLVIPVSPNYSYRIWQFASGQNITFFPYKGA